MNTPNILIRLPNWLGDMVMSTAFVHAVKEAYPGATIDLIAKKGVDFLLDYFPDHGHRYIFSKDEYKGLSGALKFGKKIKARKRYDIFFCLPDSFSSAMMAYASGAKKRAGFKNEIRSLLLTDTFTRKKDTHRVEEYVNLLQQYLKKDITIPEVRLENNATQIKNSLLININSEAASRRLPVAKAISMIQTLREKLPQDFVLLGSPKEKTFVDEVYEGLASKKGIRNMAGKTTLPQLIETIAGIPVMLTTDSGPAHVANALGTHSIVLFGAGNENNTAPYNKKDRTIIRLGELGCEPCTKNTCKLYDQPKCLTLLDDNFIAQQVEEVLNKTNHK
ncbi:glycosyltransferase family 9 protein [Ferruginibacter sp. HRS2-29]|uniref:glycosyltransferase family 9 protein n=1 Tax=Ferruginibacter sp. HRS2-29 TaxID=2487334 RepID=UPI0020CEE238|nr:glycosyltransferase family 9 protein [Ferruginibacter sp. HRS2-29]MCP9750782.1 glycosyltransferase family 9 protein [Ferruginibacter sp. HRS2-29]